MPDSMRVMAVAAVEIYNRRLNFYTQGDIRASDNARM
jgi:hypothetical protein